MSPDARETADRYYRLSATWADAQDDVLRRSRRTAWIVASVAVACAVLLALALFLLLPLKTVVPYTLMVDRQTGAVQVLKPLDAESVAPDAALTQSFLVQYVIARESFDIATVQNDYRKVALWSVDGAQHDYVAAVQITNPESPLARLPRSTIIETRVRSVSSLGNRTALVRFETIRRDRGGAAQASQSWVAVIDYRFSNAPMAVEDRYINPLGFQVLRYRRNAETLPAQVEIVPSSSLHGASTPLPSSATRSPARDGVPTAQVRDGPATMPPRIDPRPSR